MSPISSGTGRRAFLGGTGGLLFGSPLLSACGEGSGSATREITLTIDWLDTTLGGEAVRLRAYNGSVPGPTLTVDPGDVLQIVIENRLTAYDSSEWSGDHNVPHALNTTNLHLHGMDVTPHLFDPLGTDDPGASMIAIGPGESFAYTFEIPADHPPGLYWYHSHHHGSTVVQAVSGMAGPIVVRGAIDEVPEIAAARDVLTVLSDIGLFPADNGDDRWIYQPRQNAIWSTFPLMIGGATGNVWTYDASAAEGKRLLDLQGGYTTGDYRLRFYAVNGAPYYREDHNDGDDPTSPLGTALSPMTLSLRPGEVIRLRILNACSDLVMPLTIAGLDMHLIALDGTNFGAPRRLTTVEPTSWDGKVHYDAGATTLVLAPANRAEVLIRGGAPGTYELVQAGHTGQQFLAANRKVIAIMTVEGEAMDMSLPAVLPEPSRRYPLITAEQIVQERRLEFMGMFPAKNNLQLGIDFMLAVGAGTMNPVSAAYDEHVINTSVSVETAEAWTLSAPTHDGGNEEGHPFHIHVNPFEVKAIDGVPQPPGTYMDTLWIGKQQTALAWLRFIEWTGKTVYHCHILPHEDSGMMHNLMIKG